MLLSCIEAEIKWMPNAIYLFETWGVVKQHSVTGYYTNKVLNTVRQGIKAGLIAILLQWQYKLLGVT